MAVVLIKVFSLGVKTAAKPLAKRFEAYVMSHPEFRKRVLSITQAYHRWEVGRTLKNEATNGNGEAKQGGDGQKRVFVGQMADDKALKLASSVVSEGFLFLVGTGLIYLEYDRGRQKDLEKKAREEQFKRELEEVLQAYREAKHILPELQRSAVQHAQVLEQLRNKVDRIEELQQEEAQRRRRAGFLRSFSLGG